MELKEYLKTRPAAFTLVESDNIDEDWIYSESFGREIEGVENIYFNYANIKEDIFDNDGLMGLFSLARSKNILGSNNIHIVVEYTDSSDDSAIEELYDNLNLWKIPLFVSPSKEVNEDDYVGYLKKTMDRILSNENSIAVDPIYSFLQYIINNILAENFLEKDVNTENIIAPTPPADIEELYIKKVGIEKGNRIKDRVLDEITQEDRDKLKDIISTFLNSLKKNLEKEKDSLGLTLIKDPKSI